ncbi:hypothetical protein PPL_08453 [Heterostelium album PN500]|uniref:Sugar phosphate transporter domain-containing protein n=1 Tax=Heterostelium pallidum (strain ATCC 26659 / Pp 5 / PN500) TaxID=670386 RepID=D3BI85_HETP5|nr:hypothetical protein PPL_08453 [Heterostelium album PN500]EFA78985.1 hypothetical protein PPL_08453 [Heterostelium album PN500]|eukprot:XP_020431109.1 hypothetical protein PPL_08453 [Heterostelium album PN500]
MEPNIDENKIISSNNINNNNIKRTSPTTKPIVVEIIKSNLDKSSNQNDNLKTQTTNQKLNTEISIDIPDNHISNKSSSIGSFNGVARYSKNIYKWIQTNSILFQWKLEEEFKFQKLPITMMSYQMIISSFLSCLCIFVLKLTPYTPLKLSDFFFKMGPFTLLHSLNHIINALIPSQSVGMTRTLTPIITVFLQYLVLHVTFESGVYISVLIFSTGVSFMYLGSTSIEFFANPSVLGISFAIASLLSFQTVYAHRLFSTWLKPIDPLTIMLYFSPGSLMILIPSSLVFESNEIQSYLSTISNTKDLVTMISLGGIVTFFTFYMTFSINKRYDILTMALARNSKYMILKVHSHGVFQFFQIWNNFVGLILCFYGILKYKKVNIEPINLSKSKKSEHTAQS